MNDFFFGMAWNAELEDRSKNAPTFGYVFDYVPKFKNGSRVGGLLVALLGGMKGDRNDSMTVNREDDMMWEKMRELYINLLLPQLLPFGCIVPLFVLCPAKRNDKQKGRRGSQAGDP